MIKNVRNRPFHYVDENKYSYKRLSIILMKKRMLFKKQSPVTAWRGQGRLSGFAHPDTQPQAHAVNPGRQVLNPASPRAG